MNSHLKKYYQTLGLPVNGSQKEIKKAYFNLAKVYHPDVNPSDEAKRKFIEINKACEVLSNPEILKRLIYRATHPSKKKKPATKQKATNIRRRTKRRANIKEPHFVRLTAKEILIRDLSRTFDYFLVIISTFVLPVILYCLSTLKNYRWIYSSEVFLTGLGISSSIALFLLIIPFILIITHYYRTKDQL